VKGSPDGTGAAVRSVGPLVLTNATADAYIQHRKTSFTTATSGVRASTFDTAWLYNSGSSYDVTLTDPNAGGPGGAPLPEGIRCTFVVPGTQISAAATGTYQTKNTGAVNVKDHAGGVIASFPAPAAGTFKSVTIETVSVVGTILWDVVEWSVFAA
jgi:hypothetical protein